MPPTPRKPQDRRPKATTAKPFTFDGADGTTYELPPPGEAMDLVSGRVLRDAAVGGEEGQMRLGFHLLEALTLPDGALDALYDLPAPESLGIIERWLLSADKSGATLPQS